ncbi:MULTISPECIES: GspE/PulE family protein [unclassified Synechocystis]|uniref:GspE/PulE family protein n=1 Tax=unclassified Synechocystis TaxID=2640012 RepID=UPI000428563A|nr:MULTISPECIES: GspE/PulE family protein [unclassified Synechocystis]AIE75130.1 Type IV fimbrial assembly, ATPase PilB [Synechocystis sp. PCC 6714]MCT0252894.1 GspE/PulE family protein [Synechocystis sp. CS-94]
MVFSSDSSEFSLSPFEQALIEAGYLSLSQIHQALMEARRTGTALPTLVEAMLGESLPEELHRQYQAQQRFALSVIHGVKFFDHNQLMAVANTEAIASLLNRYFPLPICRQYGFLPLHYREDPGALLVVMVDPSDREASQFLQRQLAPHRLTLRRRGVTQEDFDHLIDQLYQDPGVQAALNTHGPMEISDDPYDGKATVVEVTEIIEDLPQQIAALHNVSPASSTSSVSTSPTTADVSVTTPEIKAEGPEVKLANKILILGLREGASEIHIDPQDTKVLVRIRQGGNLRMLLEPLPKELGPKLVARLKTMTHLDTSQTKVLQKARIRKSYNGQSVFFYVNILPSFYGEKVLVRVVPSLEKLPNFTELCGDRQGQESLQTLAQQTKGLVVVIGAAYGGKTSTMEAFLGEQLGQNRSVALVSDPLVHMYKGINQLEVNLEKEFTGERAVQSLEEQSLNVVAVDPLEDEETAQALTQALNQGRLVFVSVIAKDIPSAMMQLQQWFEPAVLGQHLKGIVSQRLVRQVCPACRLRVDVTPEEQQRFGLPQGPIYRANSLSVELMAQPMIKSRLCRQCHGLGYAGMTGVFEVVPITPELQQLVSAPCSHGEIISGLNQAGIASPARTAIALVSQGVTTLEEVNRLFPQLPRQLSPQNAPTGAVAPALVQSQGAEDSAPNDQWWQRLQQLENSVQELNQALADLKKMAGDRPSRTRPAPAPHLNLDLMAELRALEDLSAHKKPKPKEDQDATLLGDFNDIEELLIDELNPLPPALDAKEATFISEEPLDNPGQDKFNPFKSVIDPW